MNYFIQTFVVYLIKVLCFGFVVCMGCYMGYRANHRKECYFKKQKKLIKKHGNLMAYMYRHYYAYDKRNILKKSVKKRTPKWLYSRCVDYIKKSDEKDEIECAKVFLRSDLRISEVFSLIIAVAVGFSAPLINSYAVPIASTIGKDYGEKYIKQLTEELQNVFGLLLLIIMTILIYLVMKAIKKQQTLLSILESIDN